MNVDRHAAFNHASNCIPLRTDLVHMGDILKIAFGRSWKSERMSTMRNVEEVGVNIANTSVLICMRLLAGRIHWNVIGKHHLSLRQCVRWWIRNSEAWKLLAANGYI